MEIIVLLVVTNAKIVKQVQIIVLLVKILLIEFKMIIVIVKIIIMMMAQSHVNSVHIPVRSVLIPKLA